MTRATKNDHLKQAAHNEKLAETLCKSAYVDWAVTAYFYAALHYVTAVLSLQGTVPTSHRRRDPLVQGHKQLSKIFNEYKSLDIMSRNARYFCTPIDGNDLQSSKLKFEALKAYITHSVLGMPIS
ncbi:MAG: hypothetical protein DMG96_37780 [Acidobacteria bacterium]|nr:MAG: hypothetical protein DMG96_37780 [Acidobacteriota bacterium]